MTLEPIAYTHFCYGTTRPVFEDARGQFVIDYDGNRVDCAWFIPAEECVQPPLITSAEAELDRG